MPTVNMTRCQSCKAIMNPNWTACLVCGAGVAHPELAMTLKAEREPEAVLEDLYRKYWSTPETEPMATFQSLHREIDILEWQVGVDTAWRTLRETATALHAERGICPFCREPGELHLPTEQPERELRHG